jgi:hypothetical protein
MASAVSFAKSAKSAGKNRFFFARFFPGAFGEKAGGFGGSGKTRGLGVLRETF